MSTVSSSRAANIDAGERPWMEDDPDASLVAAAQADPRAFGLLYERYRAPIYRYCYNRLRRQRAAEDACADVFLEAFANLRRYPGGPFASWLYMIAAHVVAGHYEKQPVIHKADKSAGKLLALPPTELPIARPMNVWC